MDAKETAAAALMERFRRLCGESHDISEHLGLLRGLACDPEVGLIVEIGFRTGVSATALATADKPLHCYDIDSCEVGVRKLKLLAPKFRFHQGDSLKVEIPDCDLLHIDSLHTYTHLRAELSRHARFCRKWIVLHDTTTFASKGKDGTKPGLMTALREFLEQEGREWTALLHLTNNNGLTLLQRRRVS
jgi:hypothetical protein